MKNKTLVLSSIVAFLFALSAPSSVYAEPCKWEWSLTNHNEVLELDLTLNETTTFSIDNTGNGSFCEVPDRLTLNATFAKGGYQDLEIESAHYIKTEDGDYMQDGFKSVSNTHNVYGSGPDLSVPPAGRGIVFEITPRAVGTYELEIFMTSYFDSEPGIPFDSSGVQLRVNVTDEGDSVTGDDYFFLMNGSPVLVTKSRLMPTRSLTIEDALFGELDLTVTDKDPSSWLGAQKFSIGFNEFWLDDNGYNDFINRVGFVFDLNRDQVENIQIWVETDGVGGWTEVNWAGARAVNMVGASDLSAYLFSILSLFNSTPSEEGEREVDAVLNFYVVSDRVGTYDSAFGLILYRFDDGEGAEECPCAIVTEKLEGEEYGFDFSFQVEEEAVSTDSIRKSTSRHGGWAPGYGPNATAISGQILEDEGLLEKLNALRLTALDLLLRLVSELQAKLTALNS